MARDEADEIPIANASDLSFESGLYLLTFGAYGTTKVFVWADSVEVAFEVAAEWLDDNAPGHLVSIDEEELKAAAKDLGIPWNPKWIGPDGNDDRDFQKVIEHAEADLTQIGHTTLQHGQYVLSYEWWVDEVDAGTDDYRIVKARSYTEYPEGIRSDIEAELTRMANDAAVVALSTVDDMTVQEIGSREDEFSIVGVAEAGDALAVDGDILIPRRWQERLGLPGSQSAELFGDVTSSAAVGHWLRENGYEETRYGGDVPGGIEEEIPIEHVARALAKEKDIPEEFAADAIRAALKLKPDAELVYWGSSNAYTSVYVKQL